MTEHVHEGTTAVAEQPKNEFQPYDKYPTLAEARKLLEKVNYKEQILPIKDLSVSLAGDKKIQIQMAVDGKRMPLSKGAIKSLYKRAGINPRIYKEFIDKPELVDQMLNHSLQKRPGKVIVSHIESAVLDLYEETAVRMNPVEVFDLCVARKEIERIEKLTVEPNGAFEFSFLTGKAKEPPKKVGQPSHAGLFISCNGKIEVGSYVYTLICSNGLRAPSKRPVFIEAKDKLQEKMTQIVEEKIGESVTLLDALIHLDDHIITEPIPYMTNLMNRLRLGSRAITRLSAKLSTLPRPATAYDLVQFVTSEATASGNSRFQDFGYRVAQAFQSKRCNACASTLSG